MFTPLSIPNFRFFARVCKRHATEDLSFVLLFVTITLKGDDKGHLLKRLYVTYQSISNLLELLFPGVCVPRGGGGYSHTLHIRVCAAQRGRNFEAPDLERGIHFRGVF